MDSIDFNFERFFYETSTPCCFATMDGYFRLVNPAMERVFKRSAEELCSIHFTDMMLEEDHAESFRVMEEKMSKGESVENLQNRYRTGDGGVVWLRWNTMLDRDRNLIYATFVDITEEKERAMSPA